MCVPAKPIQATQKETVSKRISKTGSIYPEGEGLGRKRGGGGKERELRTQVSCHGTV